LADGREVYARIVEDVSQMLARAETVADGDASLELESPVITIRTLTTEYTGPDDPNAEDFGSRGQDEEPLEHGRITIEMTGWTEHPRASDFIVNAIDRWLRSNQVREGMPYQILEGSPRWRITRQDDPVGQVGAQAEAEPEPPADRRAARDPRAGRRGVSARPTGRGAGITMTGGSESSPPPDLENNPMRDANAPAGLGSLNSAYPIPRPDEGVPEGRVRTYFQVNWVVELVDPNEGGR